MKPTFSNSLTVVEYWAERVRPTGFFGLPSDGAGGGVPRCIVRVLVCFRVFLLSID